MGRNLLSPVLLRELANLEKDADSRKSAMEALKAYVKELDSKALPIFLAQISETKEIGFLSGDYTISLYEVVARVHGVNLVPHTDKIMQGIISTLAANVVSISLQQACSKVVIAIARYGIEPVTPEEEKSCIIDSLCKPLCDSLLGSQESLASGAALCLKALVDMDNWQFASDEMVNRVCQNATAALNCIQSNSHMGLVMSLAEHNALILEAYARLLIQSGLQILHSGITEGNSQKRLSAIKMINFLVKFLDPRSVYSELKPITEEMERLQSDETAFVSGAAFEAWETARKVAAEEEVKFEKESCSITGSNFRRRQGGRKNGGSSSSDRSSGSVSPESCMVDEYNLPVESSISSRLASPGFNSDRKSGNRRLWRFENGGVDVSLKDGLFSELGKEDGLSYTHSRDSRNQVLDNVVGDCIDEFQGFGHGNSMNGVGAVISVPSPQVSPCKEDSSKMGIFKTSQTPNNFVQVPSEMNWKSSKGQIQSFRSLPLSTKMVKANETLNGDVEHLHNAMAYLSTEHEVIETNRSGSGTDYRRQTQKRPFLVMICGLLFVLLALSTSLQWNDVQFEVDHLVPT